MWEGTHTYLGVRTLKLFGGRLRFAKPWMMTIHDNPPSETTLVDEYWAREAAIDVITRKAQVIYVAVEHLRAMYTIERTGRREVKTSFRVPTCARRHSAELACHMISFEQQCGPRHMTAETKAHTRFANTLRIVLPKCSHVNCHLLSQDLGLLRVSAPGASEARTQLNGRPSSHSVMLTRSSLLLLLRTSGSRSTRESAGSGGHGGSGIRRETV